MDNRCNSENESDFMPGKTTSEELLGYLRCVCKSPHVTRAVLRRSIETYRQAQSLRGEAASSALAKSDQLLGLALDVDNVKDRLPYAEQVPAVREALRRIEAANTDAFHAAVELQTSAA